MSSVDTSLAIRFAMSRLSRYAHHLAYLLNELGAGALRRVLEATGAKERDPWEKRKAELRPFCKAATACGAQWSCNGYGNLKLIEPYGGEPQAAVVELLDHFGLPSRMSPANRIERRAIITEFLTTLVELDLSLPMRNLKRADDAECAEGRVLSGAEVVQRDESKYPYCDKQRKGAHLVRCPLKELLEGTHQLQDHRWSSRAR